MWENINWLPWFSLKKKKTIAGSGKSGKSTPPFASGQGGAGNPHGGWGVWFMWHCSQLEVVWILIAFHQASCWVGRHVLSSLSSQLLRWAGATTYCIQAPEGWMCVMVGASWPIPVLFPLCGRQVHRQTRPVQLTACSCFFNCPACKTALDGVTFPPDGSSQTALKAREGGGRKTGCVCRHSFCPYVDRQNI